MPNIANDHTADSPAVFRFIFVMKHIIANWVGKSTRSHQAIRVEAFLKSLNYVGKKAKKTASSAHHDEEY